MFIAAAVYLTVLSVLAWPWEWLDFMTYCRVGMAAWLLFMLPQYLWSCRILSAVEAGRVPPALPEPGRRQFLAVIVAASLVLAIGLIADLLAGAPQGRRHPQTHIYGWLTRH